MSSQTERFIHHLLQVDPRNSYNPQSHQARVFLQSGTDESALFHLDPEAVTAYLEKLTIDAASLWPEAPPDLRAFRLLSLHLMETVRGDPDEVFQVTPIGVSPSAR